MDRVAVRVGHHVLPMVASWPLNGTRRPRAWCKLLRTTWCCVPDGCHAVAAVLRRQTVGGTKCALFQLDLPWSISPLRKCHAWTTTLVHCVCRQSTMVHLSGLSHLDKIECIECEKTVDVELRSSCSREGATHTHLRCSFTCTGATTLFSKFTICSSRLCEWDRCRVCLLITTPQKNSIYRACARSGQSQSVWPISLGDSTLLRRLD